MTLNIIIIICVLLLLAYIFDLTATKTRIPSVILLLFLGWSVKLLSKQLNFYIPDLEVFLQIFGVLGLILIVLEGALEIEFDRSKFQLIKKTSLISFISLIALSICIAIVFQFFQSGNFRDGLINALPFCVISSAIAIPSVKHLSKYRNEFIIYESSLSDIIGVILFNFLMYNSIVDFLSVAEFTLQLAILAIISFVATIVLSVLMSKIEHRVKFAPIIILLILIYALSEILHLPALVFILVFGLFIGNINRLQQFRYIEKLKPDIIDKEVTKFYELIKETGFIIRAIFFLIFGFIIETSELFNVSTFLLSSIIVALVFIFRIAILKLFKIKLFPLVFISPRGLLTILLFLIIPSEMQIGIVNKSVVLQVIVISTIVMMIGIMLTKRDVSNLVDRDNNASDDFSSTEEIKEN
ncbi:MAG TPA: cation:proton antiporter [Bacteroidales bacterium]|nr:cation:proton antiporter [Bacteroidales bacterium]